MINPQTEFNCLHKLLSEKNPELLCKIEPEDFGNNDLRSVFKLVQRFFLDQKGFPGYDTLTSQVVALCSTKDKAEFMAGILMSIKERDTTGLTDALLLEELEKYRKFRLILDQSTRLIGAVESKNIDEALGCVQSLYEQSYVNVRSTLDDADAVTLMGNKIAYSFRNVGIPQLDARGPLMDGSVALLAGGTGTGKTNFALQIDLYQYFNYGDSVAYHSYELSREEIYNRILSQIAEVNVGNIMSDNLSDEERAKVRLAEATFLYKPSDDMQDFVKTTFSSPDDEFKELLANTYTRRDNRFFIFDETSNWDQLLMRMKLLRDTRGVSKFTIDYFTLVSRAPSLDRNVPEWQALLKMAAKLKLFAKEDGKKTRIVSPAQYKDKEAELKFSQNLQNDVDLYLAMSQDNDDKTLGTVTVDFKKFRTYLGNPPLKPFKMMIQGEYSKFAPFEM